MEVSETGVDNKSRNMSFLLSGALAIGSPVGAVVQLFFQNSWLYNGDQCQLNFLYYMLFLVLK